MHGHSIFHVVDILSSYPTVNRLLILLGTKHSIESCDPAVLRDYEQRAVVLHAYRQELHYRGVETQISPMKHIALGPTLEQARLKD